MAIRQPLWTKARWAPVGECICQHLSQYAGWMLQSRLPTNLTDKQCHPPVSNILGGRRGYTVQSTSPHHVLALPPLCYDAGGLCCHVLASGWFFYVLSVLAKATHIHTHKHKHTHRWLFVWASSKNVIQSGFQSNSVGVFFVFYFGKALHSQPLGCSTVKIVTWRPPCWVWGVVIVPAEKAPVLPCFTPCLMLSRSNQPTLLIFGK